MNLFEFLMILLSLIVGLGLAELLSGVARMLKTQGWRGFSMVHGAITLTIFIGLLQSFWEAWGLRSIETWSFPAMLLMLSSPILLFLIAHILFPGQKDTDSLEEHYFKRASLIWTLAGVTVVLGTLFRPLAFDMPLWVVDNFSAVPTLLVCLVLSLVSNSLVHKIFVPLVLAFVLWDTLAMSYSIG